MVLESLTNFLWLMLGLSSISVSNFITFPQAALWAAIDFQSGRIINRKLTNTIGAIGGP